MELVVFTVDVPGVADTACEPVHVGDESSRLQVPLLREASFIGDSAPTDFSSGASAPRRPWRSVGRSATLASTWTPDMLDAATSSTSLSWPTSAEVAATQQPTNQEPPR